MSVFYLPLAGNGKPIYGVSLVLVMAVPRVHDSSCERQRVALSALPARRGPESRESPGWAERKQAEHASRRLRRAANASQLALPAVVLWDIRHLIMQLPPRCSAPRSRTLDVCGGLFAVIGPALAAAGLLSRHCGGASGVSFFGGVSWTTGRVTTCEPGFERGDGGS